MKTIKIKNEKSDSGYCLINECDFVDGEHVRFEEEKTEIKAKAPTKAKKVTAKK